MSVLRPIGHEDRLSVVDHLDELRTRLFVCFGALFVAFLVCFWQNGALINALNRALPSEASVATHSAIAGTAKTEATEHQGFETLERGEQKAAAALKGAKGIPPGLRRGLDEMVAGTAELVKATPKTAPSKEKPITIGIGESFTTTLLVVGYFSLLFALPVILYQLYAFVIPALSPKERRSAIPAMLAAPVLFMTGVVFTYFEVLPPAIHFLQGYNGGHFQILAQASSYYKFEILIMLGIGLTFQVPLFLAGLHSVGVITSRTLTVNWRYAIVLIAIVAAALPGVDPVTMTFETLPLVVLYLASIVLLKYMDRRAAKRAAAEAASTLPDG